MISVGGVRVELDAEFVDLSDREFENGDELAELLRLNRLQYADFAYSDLDDDGLAVIGRIGSLEGLDLQCTRITDGGLRHLREMPSLTALRLKENRQLTNACVEHLLEIRTLANLQIHWTSIDHDGLRGLASLPNLEFLCLRVEDDNFSAKDLDEFRRRKPDCQLVAMESSDGASHHDEAV